MKTIFIIFFLLLPLRVQANLVEQDINPNIQHVIQISDYLSKFGDHPDWASPQFDDSDWPMPQSSERSRPHKGIHWFRKSLTIQKEVHFTEPYFIYVFLIQSAYEVYWDGEMIGTNGRVGATKKEERPGRSIYKVEIDKDRLKPGRHTLAVRISNFRSGRWFAHGGITLAGEPPMGHLNATQLPGMFHNVFFTGIFLTATIVGLALFFSGDRYRPYLVFAGICLGAAMWRGFRFLLEYLNLNTTSASIFWPMNHFFFDIMTAGIILFILVNFRITKKRIHLCVFGMLFIIRLLAFEGILPSPFHFVIITLIPAYILYLLVQSIQRRKSGSTFALAGYVSLIIPMVLSFFNVHPTWDAGMVALTVFMTAIILSISRQLHEQTRMQKALDMRSQRLENELLKKTIQPHFVMNTLQSIKSLSRSQPEKAVQLIESFADEFRVLNRVASESEIAMEEEIQLCKSHLELMGYRWKAEYALETDSIKMQEKIPPLIFHTLIENGLTHAFRPKESGSFRLSRQEEGGVIQYCLRNNGSRLSALERRSQEQADEGMGLKYVRTRLEESYPGKWSLSYGLRDHWWEVFIEITK